MRALLVLALLLGAGCGEKDPCEGIPCSPGRVCVVKSTERVACEVPDAGP